MPELRLGFAGSPEFAAHQLERLSAAGYAPELVLTQPDAPSGRGRKLKPNPVKQLALSRSQRVLQPLSLKKDLEAVEALAAAQLDVLIVAAYGLILPQTVLDLPRLGCVNVHASLLPRWRGAAPIERAIMAGDTRTGVCMMQMEAGLDTGPIYQQQSVELPSDATAAQIETHLAEVGATLLIELLQGIEREGALPKATPQDQDGVTYADKLTAADRRIDWSHDAQQIHNQIRALCDRMPVRTQLDDTGVQLLKSRVVANANLDHADPGTITHMDKTGIFVSCATETLQITSLKVERGKGSVLDPAAARNGFADLFRVGHQLR